MRSTITILLVDDHAIVRQGCRLLLQQAGFEIAGEAASGEDAYASCLQHSPRVVIMDLAMPGMGGLEAIPRIRAFSWTFVTVMLFREETTYTNRTTVARGRRCPPDHDRTRYILSRAKLCEMGVRLADLAD